MNLARVNVLDHGYVLLVDHMGDDLRAVNAARVSFNKRSTEFKPEDEKLLDYLVRNKHLSPFRHSLVTLEMCAPLMVCRQIQRYLVGYNQTDPVHAWNEASGRYIRMDEYYIPDYNEWRGAPDNKKQGSKGHVDLVTGEKLTAQLSRHVDECVRLYEWAIDSGVATEQARLFLPANGQYTSWWLTASLQGIIHLLEERGDPHAMWETRQYAAAIYCLVRPLFERSMGKLLATDLASALDGAE
jgi:thymidylate synthase (FAD)